jgi:2-polyprenyl-6-methoxyphenol hydroxylase-like FAD-dependent oxidoreductase
MSGTPLPTSTDVLVVGAGPAGLALSTALALGGVDHLTIERNEAVDPGTKAAGIQPRTLEFLATLGVAAELVAAGVRGDGFALHDGDRTLMHLDFGRLDTAYPFLLLLGQQATEQILNDHALTVGARIERGYRMLDWTPDHPGVSATVVGPDGVVRAVRARYLVGADGVHSAVRQRAGIPFTGSSSDQLFALADVRLAEPPPDRDTAFFLSAAGLVLVSALPAGLHRVVASVAPGTPRPDTTGAAQTLLSERAGNPYRQAEVTEVVAASTYHVRQRVADRFVDGPVVLLGDAAHTHSPAGGQGLNTGIQDAAGLAWRLAEICRHGGDPALLTGYDDERRPVAHELISFTGWLTALATLTAPDLIHLRNTVLDAVSTAPGVTDWLARRLSQLSIGYAAEGPGTRLDPRLLARRPDRPRWVLADPEATGTAEHGRVLTIPAPDLTTTVLLRPDGYVDAVGPAAAQRVAHLNGGR